MSTEDFTWAHLVGVSTLESALLRVQILYLKEPDISQSCDCVACCLSWDDELSNKTQCQTRNTSQKNARIYLSQRNQSGINEQPQATRLVKEMTQGRVLNPKKHQGAKEVSFMETEINYS